MEYDQTLSEEDVMRYAWNQALDGLRALADGNATVIRNRDGQTTGVEWTPEGGDCPEVVMWGIPDDAALIMDGDEVVGYAWPPLPCDDEG